MVGSIALSPPCRGECIAAPQLAARRPEVVNLPMATRSEDTVAGAASGNSSQDISNKEKALYWEGCLEEYIEKKHSKPIWNVRYMFLSVYRRLFSITLAANMSVLIGLAATHQANTGKIAYVVISNPFVSILMHQECHQHPFQYLRGLASIHPFHHQEDLHSYLPHWWT